MIKSKKIKKKHLRKKSASILDEEENLEETSNLIQEAMEIRKFRKRPEGMETKELSIGEENQKPVEAENEPQEQVSKSFSDTGIVSSFKTQTNYMDTEKLMNKYIEDEIRKNRGEKVDPEEEEKEEELQQNTGANSEFNNIYDIPENLKVKEKYIKEDNVTTSLSMLTSIQEVDLGIENKLKNIEDTEKARKKLEEDNKKKKNTVNNMVGVTVAAERFYHAKMTNRKIERMFGDKEKKEEEEKRLEEARRLKETTSQNPLINKINNANARHSNKYGHRYKNYGNENPTNSTNANHSTNANYNKRNMATDDIAYERFKKRLRR